jgi:lipoprotein-anchoring transpeptidase ErfK/SrfK
MHKSPQACAIALLLSGLVFTAVPAVASAARVGFETTASAGTIVVKTSERRLYLVLGHGEALRYTVGVGRAGREWAGSSSIGAKFLQPNWAPPAEIRKDKPGLPAIIPGGTAANPMGAAAMTLAGGPYAIHGTNSPKSIGGFVSYGCIRMYNEDISDLYHRVHVGTPVVVLQ